MPDTLTLPYVTSFSDARPGDELPRGWEPWTLSKLKKATLLAQDFETVVTQSIYFARNFVSLRRPAFAVIVFPALGGREACAP